MALQFHKHEHSPGWYYFAIGEWQPFKRFGASGWVYFNRRWIWSKLWGC